MVTVALAIAVNTLHFNYAVGIASDVLLVPTGNFVEMNWWGFRSGLGCQAAVQTQPDVNLWKRPIF